MPARFWKWRLSGAPFTFAEEYAKLDFSPDLLVFANTIDVAAFLALAGRRAAQLPRAIYFHENQIVYPASPNESPDVHYGLINMASALACDKVWFNSRTHKDEFLTALDPFMKRFPDHQPQGLAQKLEARCEVLQVPVDVPSDVAPALDKGKALRILWNHRWEYDKGPDEFYEAVKRLAALNVDFELVLLGESFRNIPPVFPMMRDEFGERILAYGYCESREEYWSWLKACDVVVSCAKQENFGVSVAEAVLAACYPILPDRLVYPELIPELVHENHLYRDTEGLAAMLEKAALIPDGFRLSQPLPFYDAFTSEKIAARFDEQCRLLANC